MCRLAIFSRNKLDILATPARVPICAFFLNNVIWFAFGRKLYKRYKRKNSIQRVLAAIQLGLDSIRFHLTLPAIFPDLYVLSRYWPFLARHLIKNTKYLQLLIVEVIVLLLLLLLLLKAQSAEGIAQIHSKTIDTDELHSKLCCWTIRNLLIAAKIYTHTNVIYVTRTINNKNYISIKHRRIKLNTRSVRSFLTDNVDSPRLCLTRLDTKRYSYHFIIF